MDLLLAGRVRGQADLAEALVVAQLVVVQHGDLQRDGVQVLLGQVEDQRLVPHGVGAGVAGRRLLLLRLLAARHHGHLDIRV